MLTDDEVAIEARWKNVSTPCEINDYGDWQCCACKRHSLLYEHIPHDPHCQVIAAQDIQALLQTIADLREELAQARNAAANAH